MHLARIAALRRSGPDPFRRKKWGGGRRPVLTTRAAIRSSKKSEGLLTPDSILVVPFIYRAMRLFWRGHRAGGRQRDSLQSPGRW